MVQNENFEIKYWGTNTDRSLYQNPQEQKRSIRKKLFIVLSFIIILAVFPVLFLGVTNLKLGQDKKISILTQIKPAIKPTSTPTSTPTPTPEKKPVLQKTSTSITVKNNDSYWKISKRQCGTGKYYLSIRDQNAAKALHKGDGVTANCVL